jgi:membrane-associated protease RseP (regulator of RpoE activity)
LKLALGGRFRQIHGVRWLGLVAATCALVGSARADRRHNGLATPPVPASAVVAPTPPASSNPAFLGIKMVDGNPGCIVEGVTSGSAADDAGLREWDRILALDGIKTTNCTQLRTQIISNAPGHVVRLDVRRKTELISVSAPLSTRAEVLHRRLVGHVMDPTDVVDADDTKQSYDLAQPRGKVTVIGWFMIERCSGCSAVFDRVADNLHARLDDGGNAPFVLAVTPEPTPSNVVVPQAVPQAAPQIRKSYGFTTSVPLALANPETFAELAIDDPERVHFMVIDCRGVVRFVEPIAPGSDDMDAAVDEVIAAAEQAEHARTQRR